MRAILSTIPREIGFWVGLPVRAVLALFLLATGLLLMPGDYDEIKGIAKAMVFGEKA